jgi:hypothetical protein
VVAYFSRFVPPSSCELVGVEQILGAVRFDLIWRSPSGRVWADEIKSGSYRSLAAEESMVVQLLRECAELQLHHERVVGVRLVPLRCPSRAVWLAPDGLLRPVSKELFV